jgi:transposase
MESSTLLPCVVGIELDSVTTENQTIVVRLSTVAPYAACPLCGQLSERVHSRYGRTLTDLPWNRISVRLHLRTRKFFCGNSGCERQVFTQPVQNWQHAMPERRFASRTYCCALPI